jgi:hypothetical protein
MKNGDGREFFGLGVRSKFRVQRVDEVLGFETWSSGMALETRVISLRLEECP